MKRLIYEISNKCAIIMMVMVLLLMIGIKSEAREPRVYDDANLLTNSEIETLEEEIRQSAANVGIDIILVSTDNTGRKSTMNYADDYYDDLYSSGEFGDKSDEGYASGVLFLIDMDNREIYISTDTENELKYTDNEIEQMLDRLYPYVSEGDYFGAFSQFNTLAVRYARVSSGDGVRYDTDAALMERTIRILIGSLILAIIVTVSFVLAAKKKKTANKHTYLASGGINNLVNQDFFIRTTVSKRHIERNSSGSSGGGSSSRTSTHRSSSGRSHGGGGRKF